MSEFASPTRTAWVDRQPKRFASAVMLCESPSGEVLAVKSHYKPYWTLPGGIIDPGETPKECAIRETLEEVGLTILPEDVHFVAVVDRRSEVAETYQFIFSTKLEKETLQHIQLQESEVQAFEFISKKQIESKDRPYAKALMHWASGTIGYIEQTFEGREE
ncbi:MAG TPA: NUDIX hydrolase [Candidatus Saccharimonadales bacterium]|nr:NUDIX hydrolase [Candidatus Saccharimonadales bacterium]